MHYCSWPCTCNELRSIVQWGDIRLTEMSNAGSLVWRARIAAMVNQPPQKGHQGPFMLLNTQSHDFEVAIKCYLQPARPPFFSWCNNKTGSGCQKMQDFPPPPAPPRKKMPALHFFLIKFCSQEKKSGGTQGSFILMETLKGDASGPKPLCSASQRHPSPLMCWVSDEQMWARLIRGSVSYFLESIAQVTGMLSFPASFLRLLGDKLDTPPPKNRDWLSWFWQG